MNEQTRTNEVDLLISIGKVFSGIAFFFFAALTFWVVVPHVWQWLFHPAALHHDSFCLCLDYGFFRIWEPASLWLASLFGLFFVWAGVALCQKSTENHAGPIVGFICLLILCLGLSGLL